ncbi:MAG: glutamate--tRNA ligase [Patescibacteria group bacterium]
MAKNTKVRVRFAPSPTGYLHIGGLRTALYNYLFAKNNGGDFVLRIEDTDQDRSVVGAVENLLNTLKWAGLDYDEGPSIGGQYGPYVQSERLGLYRQYADELVQRGQAYYCFCSSERLTELRDGLTAQKQPPMYDRHCLNLDPAEVKERIKKGEPHVIRLKIPEGKTKFKDLIKGEVEIDNKTIDDQVLLKSDGFPTYHLAVVVDDHLMKITHVLRGDEWLPSTPKHVLLYQAFGWSAPEFAHLPTIVNKDKTKLSKRQGDVAVEDYIKQGYLPQAIINFIVLLGWNPGQGSEEEVFSLDQLIKKFSFDHVHKSNAVFDRDKLDWFNGVYIRQLTPDELLDYALSYFNSTDLGDKFDAEYIKKVISLEQSRIKKLVELPLLTKFFFEDNLDYPAQILVWKKSDKNKAQEVLAKLFTTLEQIEAQDWQPAKLEAVVVDWIKNNSLTNGEVMWPLRVALTGQEASPGPFEVAAVLGPKRSLNRIQKAIDKLK